jgi:DNA-binding NtrC family response regulator
MARVLLVQVDVRSRVQLQAALAAGGHSVVACSDILDAPVTLSGIDAIVADRTQASSALRERRDHAAVPLIVTAPVASRREIVDFVRAGAADVIVDPGADGAQELLASLDRETVAHDAFTGNGHDVPDMLGTSPPMQALFARMRKVAQAASTVLVHGESGTGKALVARALHAMGPRRHRPLVALNCAGIPDTLHDGDPFAPGASPLAAADGGTLFLDEVGELPPEAQARLLHLLADDGAGADVRLITATHHDLRQLVAQGRFRDDLFYRLDGVSLVLPPLRERPGDIPGLAAACLARTARRLHRPLPVLDEGALAALQAYAWPGNVRELQNAVERAVILCEGDVIDAGLLSLAPPARAPQEEGSGGDTTTLDHYFLQFVLAHQDHLTETELARKLGISRKSLWERRQRFGVPRRRTQKRGLRGAP